jgi:FkbM family methyltransferase
MLSRIVNQLKQIKWRLEDSSIIKKSQLYSIWEQQQLTKIFTKFSIDCVFDVGANYGQYAIMLRKKCGFRGVIISFEPNPDAAKYLRKISADDPLWIIKELALSDCKGETTFNIMKGDQFSSISSPRHDQTQLFTENNTIEISIIVETDILENIYNELLSQYDFSKPFLKLDTQGYDVHILKNAGNCINSFVGLQSELAIKKIYEDSVYYFDAIKYYESLGFTLSAFVPNNPGHFPILVETDCLMINNNYLEHKQFQISKNER